ncbi:gliding motility-associated-like protein [Flavobacterium arsenatis]|uniref:Gliding motility-associated-like protein n=1 Tax=Flavobacterium arsenatis TaxID=1484332 RepID=A0ABU1TP59_9FLAO|nr:PKD domain-containing protein [Flavobacterium arsenatis]MDR6967740.1 gliding motility-associated-like protein [Flavobacterium arsenatis]
MKLNYFVIVLLSVFNFGFSSNLTPTFVPSATISGGTTACQNTTNVLVTFTGSDGVAPYTFKYKINGGSDLTVTTISGNSITVPVVTTTAGSFNYTLVSVSDSSDPVVTQNIVGNTVFTILPQANATINSSADSGVFGGFPVFKICDSQPSEFLFNNASTTISTNTSYTISWGDGSPNFTGTTWSSLTHTYQVGLWNLVYTVTAQNGCNITKTYKVFVGNNPAVGLENPGNTDICISSPLTFPITGTDNNPPGTIYVVSFNDGSSNVTFNHPPPSSVTHTFLTTSCGTSSFAGSTTYQNSFFASIQASNPCDQSSASVVPIRVSTPPISSFSSPINPICIGNSVCLTSTTTGGQTATSSSCSVAKKVWSIFPNLGYSLGSGTLGDDFGNTNINLWSSGSEVICPIFSIAGTYTITLKTGNKCGIDIITKTICVQPQLVPNFTLNTISGCSPLAVTTTNTTNLTNLCDTPTYNWIVNYTPGNCGTTSGFVYTNGTSATSATPSFSFTEAGIYTISLKTTNSCGSVTSVVQTVNVRKPPDVSIATIAGACGSTTISPVANVTNCGPTSSSITYTWSFVGGSPSTASTLNPGSINYTTPGTYTVSLLVNNECGASNTATQTFTINPSPTITNTDLTQTICSGTPTTPVTFSANPSGTTFSWTATATTGVSGFMPSGTTAVISAQTITTTNANPGTVTYVVTPKIGNCTGTAVSYVINVIPAPTITSQPASSVVCLNGTATPLTVVISTSTGMPTYQWYSNSFNTTTNGTPIPGANSSVFVPQTSTTGTVFYYCIISLSSGGCSSLISNIASVQVVPVPTISTQPLASQNLCVGVTITNPLTVSFSNGTGTASYQWYSNSTNATTGGTLISGATSATYTPGVFSTLGNHYYYATITFSGNNCGSITSEIALINVSADPTLTTQPIADQTLCQGATPEDLEVEAIGGNGTFIYQWYSNTLNNTSGTIILGENSTTFTPPTISVGTRYYYCIVSQSTLGCGITSSISKVVVNQSPSVANQPLSSTVCLGGNPVALSFTVTNGTGSPSYQWYSNTANNTTNGTAIVGETNATFTPSGGTVGTLYYYCLINFPLISGSCATISTNTAEVEVTTAAIIDQNPLSTQSLCVGTTISTPLTVSFSGGTGTPTYQWFLNAIDSNSGGNAIAGATSATFTPSVFTGLGTFYYYVNITFAGSGCGSISSSTATVVVVADPVISLQPLSTQTLCQNAVPNSLSVAATGGIGNSYNYQWYSSLVNSNLGGTLIPGATNATFIPSTAVVGTIYYYCTITQAIGSGCDATSDTAAVIINTSPAINLQPLSNSWCVSQTPLNLTVTYTTGTGTPTYQWYSNIINSTTGGTLINGATTANYLPLTNTVGNVYYYCIITFSDLSGGCEVIVSNTALITVNPFPIIASDVETICSNTTFLVTPINGNGNLVPTGTTYTWTTPVVNPPGSLSGFSSQSVPQQEISQTLLNSTINPATIVYTVTPKTGICVGNDFTVTITVNPAINPNVIVNNNDCFGANNASIATNITGGIPPYSITWTGPNGFASNTATISNLEPGIYNILIEDAGNCPFNDSYTITQPDDIVISIANQSSSSCFESNDGMINIEVSGGTGAYFYTWTKDNLPFATTQDLVSLSPGDYNVSVTDENNCGPKTLSFTITEPPLLVVSLLNQTNINCFGASTGIINVEVVGGTIASNYIFSWTGSNGFISTNQNLIGLSAGTYNLIVTDDNGCQKTMEVVLTQSTPIVLTYTTTAITCYGANDASFNATISGGNAPYQFAWSNLSTVLNQNNLSAGNYTITITDNLGCVKMETINIPEAPIFTVNPIVKNITCFGANNGSIQLNLTGGIAPVALIWSDGSTSGLTRNNLVAGTYTATISDGTPCYIIRTFTIVEPQLLVASANLINPIDCTNGSSGAIDLIISGGTPPFTYSWSNGSSTEDLNNLVAGNYSVVVTDFNGCTISSQYSLIRPEPLKINVTTTTDSDCDLREVTTNFIAQASGGVPPYQYQWSSGSISGLNSEIMTTDTNGTVILTVEDSIGCIQTYTVNVDNTEIGEIAFQAVSIGFTSFGIYSIEDTIHFNSSITGDYESVYWDFGDGLTSTELNPTHTYSIPKDYVVTLTVTYPFGCVYKFVVTLAVEKGYVLVLPTAFTPNSDSLNDAFRPVTKNLKNVVMHIYDSWGSLIYSEKGDVIKGWDAKIKGFNAENGNYYSKVVAETFYGTIVYENQTFVLIK